MTLFERHSAATWSALPEVLCDKRWRFCRLKHRKDFASKRQTCVQKCLKYAIKVYS